MATKADPLSYRNFWEEAQDQEFGIRVECASEDDKRLLVNALYECRKVLGMYEELSIFQPHPSNTFYICKRALKEMP
jgi:hypothetical protein